MGSYTVQIVSGEVRDWNSSKGGPMKSYRIGLTDEQGNNINGVEWARKADSAAPQVGQKLEGTLETTDYGPKFKAAQQQGFGGGGRPRDPVENARIIRQHSQEMGLRYVAIRGKPDFSLDDLRTIIDWFDADAKAAKP